MNNSFHRKNYSGTLACPMLFIEFLLRLCFFPLYVCSFFLGLSRTQAVERRRYWKKKGGAVGERGLSRAGLCHTMEGDSDHILFLLKKYIVVIFGARNLHSAGDEAMFNILYADLCFSSFGEFRSCREKHLLL